MKCFYIRCPYFIENCVGVLLGFPQKAWKRKKKKKKKGGREGRTTKGKKKGQVVYGLVIIENGTMSIWGYIYSSLYSYIHLENL